MSASVTASPVLRQTVHARTRSAPSARTYRAGANRVKITFSIRIIVNRLWVRLAQRPALDVTERSHSLLQNVLTPGERNGPRCGWESERVLEGRASIEAAGASTSRPAVRDAMRMRGLEPPRPEGHRHLKPARLPFRHIR